MLPFHITRKVAIRHKKRREAICFMVERIAIIYIESEVQTMRTEKKEIRVKGEIHDATLYLETDRQRYLFDYSRKLAYVGMSRPKKLLCVAMQDKTYEKSNGYSIFTGKIL